MRRALNEKRQRTPSRVQKTLRRYAKSDVIDSEAAVVARQQCPDRPHRDAAVERLASCVGIFRYCSP